MKFKYEGEDNCFCIELLAYKLVPKGSYLKHGQVIDVPDDIELQENEWANLTNFEINLGGYANE